MTISITEAPAANFVYQRGAVVEFSGTYTTTPTALQYRVLNAADDTTELVTWTTFDAAPAGSVFTLSFTPPTTVQKMHVEVRFSNDTGVTDLQTVDWLYGIRGLIYGQSLAQDFKTDGAVTAPAGYIYYTGSVFSAPTSGAGANGLAQLLIDMYGCAVCLTSTGVGATPMTSEVSATNWSDPGASLFTDTVTRVTNMTNSDQRLEFALFIQGNTDATNSVSEARYLNINNIGGINALLSNSRENWTSKTGGTLPIVLGVLGRGNTASAAFQAIRNAHLTISRVDPLCFQMPVFHLATSDGIHPTVASYAQLGEDCAALVAYINGDISVKNPAVVAVSRNAGATEFTLTFDTDLLATDTAYSTEGLRIEDSSGEYTITSFARDGTRGAKITTSAAVANTDSITVHLVYGSGSAITDGDVLTYPRSANVALPNSAGNYNFTAENATLELTELA